MTAGHKGHVLVRELPGWREALAAAQSRWDLPAYAWWAAGEFGFGAELFAGGRRASSELVTDLAVIVVQFDRIHASGAQRTTARRIQARNRRRATRRHGAEAPR